MLTSIDTIVYATDLGQGMRPALRMAMSLAQQHQAKLIFLTVIDPVNPSIYNYISPEVLREIKDQSYARAQEEAEKRIVRFFDEEIDKDFSIDYPSIKIIYGHTAQSILSYADETNADLIVMGSHGHNALGSLLLGSVADKVMRLSKRPVLLVPVSEHK